MLPASRICNAGWHLSAEGVAYDFQGLCSPGELPSQQSARTCDVPYYRHQSGVNVFYDTRGYCDPAKTQQSGAQDAVTGGGLGGTITTMLLWGGLAYGAYYLWKNRKSVFSAA
jgi:hypothetical protein